MHNKNRIRQALVIRLTAMGDVAMTAPIVASVCEANPNVQFTYLSVPFHEPFFEDLPNFRFVGTNIRKERHGLLALWRLYRALKRYADFDCVIDLHDVLRSKVLRLFFGLSGAKVCKIDKGRSEKKALTSGKRRTQLTPMSERYRQVFEAAGLTCPRELRFRQTEEVPSGSGLPSKEGERWIGISPFAQHAGKMYPMSRMTEVMDILLREKDVRLLIFGGGKIEKEQAEKMVQRRERIHNMIGVMTLRDEMALMSNLYCMLSMDSSAMHVCSLYGVRVVSVWGATHRFAGFLGYGQSENDVVERIDLDCRPCSVFGNKPCRYADYRCMDISPERIAERILNK